MARYVALGFASIYLWRNVKNNLSEDYLNSPRKIFDDFGRLLIRLGNPNESLLENSSLESVSSFLERIRNVFSKIPLLTNNSSKLENIIQGKIEQKTFYFDKTYDGLNKTKIVPIRSTTNFQDIQGFDHAKNELINYISTFNNSRFLLHTSDGEIENIKGNDSANFSSTTSSIKNKFTFSNFNSDTSTKK